MKRNGLIAAVIGTMGAMLPYTDGMSMIGRIMTGVVFAAVAFIYIVGTDPTIGREKEE